MKKIKPLNDQVVLKPIEVGTKKVGNIIIPDMGQEKPLLAEVIETSEGIYNWHTGETKPHSVKKGDIVALPKLGAVVLPVDGEEYYICQAQQLLVVIYEQE